MPRPPFVGVKPNINDVLDYAEELAAEAYENAKSDAIEASAVAKPRRRLLSRSSLSFAANAAVDPVTSWTGVTGDGGNSGDQSIPHSAGYWTMPEDGLYQISFSALVESGHTSRWAYPTVNLYVGTFNFKEQRSVPPLPAQESLSITAVAALSMGQSIKVRLATEGSPSSDGGALYQNIQLSIVRLGDL